MSNSFQNFIYILTIVSGIITIFVFIQQLRNHNKKGLITSGIITFILVVIIGYIAIWGSGKSDYTEQPTYTPTPTTYIEEEIVYPNIDMNYISENDVTSSGYLVGLNDGISYYDTFILDDNLRTAWLDADTNGFGYNEWIQINFDQTYLVNGIQIYSGVHSNYEFLHRNNRIKDIEIVFSDGTSFEKTLADTSPQEYNIIEFEESVATESIRFVIKSVYPADYPDATCWDDTAISEIILY